MVSQQKGRELPHRWRCKTERHDAVENRLQRVALAPSPEGAPPQRRLTGQRAAQLLASIYITRNAQNGGWRAGEGVSADCSQDPLVRNPPCSVSVS